MRTSSGFTVIGAVFASLILLCFSGEAFALNWTKVQPQPNQPKISPMPNLKPMPNNPQVKPLPKFQPKLSPMPNLKPMPMPQPKPKPPAMPGPKSPPHHGSHHGPHHGGNFGFYVAPPSGHCETITETIMVEPERVEKFWVPAEYTTLTDASGKVQTVKVRDGYLAERIIPARYETVNRQVWVPHGGPNIGLGFRF